MMINPLKNTVKVLFAIIFILNMSSCNKSDDVGPRVGLHKQNEIVVDGQARSYDYYTPEDLESSSIPLLFLLHGGGSCSDDLTGESGFKAPYKVWMDIADEEKFIIVYPNGVITPLDEQGWNDCRADASNNPLVDDVAFLNSLIDHFASEYTVDTNRIYTSGTSNGGHMSIRLALESSDRIAAIASVVASMPADRCFDPVNPISVLFMLGTDDPISPYDGGEVAPNIGGRGTVLNAQESIGFWVAHNQCDTVPEVIDYPDLTTKDKSTVTSFTYSNGLEGTEVVFYKVSGGGHVEPSIQEQYSGILAWLLGKQNHDIEMATEIWDFFRNKTLNE